LGLLLRDSRHGWRLLRRQRDPSRLVTLFYGHQGRVSPWLSPLNARDLVGLSDAFAGASSVVPVTVNMTGLGDPERLQGARVDSVK
jgi:hypothetical protein